MITSTQQLGGGQRGRDLPDRVDLWVVYANPSDYPGKFVARRWIKERFDTHFKGTAEKHVSSNLQALRDEICIGRHRFARLESDDPVIVETWV